MPTLSHIGNAPTFGGFQRGVAANYARTALLLGLLTTLVVVAASWFGGTTWGLFALVFMGAVNFASYYWSDRLVIAMHRAQPLPYSAAPSVHDSVQRLARRAGIPAPQIYYVPDRAPNAFATGRNPEHAVVAVTAGALELLQPEELEGVIAHELSHVINRDVLISTVAATLAGAISLLARVAGWGLMLGGLGGRDDRERGNPLGALLLIIVAPIIALIVQLAISRSREFGADTTGARLAGSGDGLARALAKLDSVAREVPMRTADPAAAHMYIVEPLAGTASRLVHLFSTHPPIEERIRRLRALGV